jgi:hypothetical protein
MGETYKMDAYSKFYYVREKIHGARRALMAPHLSEGEEGAFRRSISSCDLARRVEAWADIGEQSAMAWRKCIEKTSDDYGANPMAMSESEKIAYANAVDELANWLMDPVSEKP